MHNTGGRLLRGGVGTKGTEDTRENKRKFLGIRFDIEHAIRISNSE